MALTEPTAGRIVKDVSLPVRITLAEACKMGDLLGYSSGWKLALATTGTAIAGVLIAGQAGAIGDVITAYREAVLSGFSGGTVGGSVYGAEGTASGEYTETAPTTTGDCDTIIGTIIAADEIAVWPGNRAPTVA